LLFSSTMTISDATKTGEGAAVAATVEPVVMVDPIQEPAMAATTAVGGLVEVVAPTDLLEGYILQINENGESFSVVVPPGGVKEGQTFLAERSSRPYASSDTPPPVGPEGKWKDGICDCCAFGCCHPALCLGCWCTTLAMAQVMTRFKLNWTGSPNQEPVSKTFQTTASILFAYICSIIGMIFLSGILAAIGVNVAGLVDIVVRILQLMFFIYVMVAAATTRREVRAHYHIPEQSCTGCEDCCCAFWCTCCMVTQMMRHSADYQQYPAACCTENGLPPDAPAHVV